jgi:drug/metabolite transporter (DMT)-like permease
MKKMVPNTDVTVSSAMQNGVSFFFAAVMSLIMDGPEQIWTCLTIDDWVGWIWLLMLGILASGVGLHSFNYLRETVGATASNYVTFAQIIVGVILGVTWLHEWAEHEWWEILMSIVGLLFLIAAIIRGFWTQGKKETPNGEQEEHPQMQEGEAPKGEHSEEDGDEPPREF